MNDVENKRSTTAELMRIAVRLLDGESVTDQERRSLLSAGAPEFLELLKYHRVAAVVSKSLGAGPETHIGREAEQVRTSLVEFRRIAAEIAQVFETNRIPYRFLKGIQLLETVYEGEPVRPMGDIDVLVRKRDVKRACEALEELGCGYPSRQIAPWFLRRFHYEITMDRGPVDIDVHWGLDHPLSLYPVSTEDVLGESEPFSVEGKTANGVSARHMLVHLILHLDRESNLSVLGRTGKSRVEVLQHAATEDWPYLIRILDIVRLLANRSSIFEDGGLIRTVTEYRIEVAAHHVLNLARLLFPRSMDKWAEQIEGLRSPGRFGITNVASLVESTVGNRHLAGLNMRPIRLVTLLELLLLGTNQSSSRGVVQGLKGIATMPIRLIEIATRTAWGGTWAAIGSILRIFS